MTTNLAASFVAELRQEAAPTRRVLERAPHEAFGWQPHERSMSLGRLAAHVAELYNFVQPITAQDELDFAAQTYEPFTPSSTNELLEAFDRNVADSVALLAEQPDERLLAPWRLRSGDQVFFEMPRAEVIRSFMLNHIVHHRGQLSVYLRLLNIPVPSIYGPSADEA